VVEGCTLTVTVDPGSIDKTKLKIDGVPSDWQWQELKDHFKEVGAVAYAGFKEASSEADAEGFGKGSGAKAGRSSWYDQDSQISSGKASYGRVYRDEAPAVGEIRYDDPEHAKEAVDYLDGSELYGRRISVEYDSYQISDTKLVVGNLSPSIRWQELKDHFKGKGTVAYAGIKGEKGDKGKGKGKSRGPY